MFWPWPTKHFLDSFNFIMKAWTATHSKIGTKPFWVPHPALPLSTRPIQICHWTFPFICAKICVKTNVCQPPSPFIPSEERLGAYRWGLCLWMCPQTLPLNLPPLPHPPITDPNLQSIRCILPWCCFFYMRGACFQIHVGWTMWLCNHENQEVESASLGIVIIVLGVLGLGLLRNTFRCCCYGLCVEEAQAMRQVQPLVRLKQW